MPLDPVLSNFYWVKYVLNKLEGFSYARHFKPSRLFTNTLAYQGLSLYNKMQALVSPFEKLECLQRLPTQAPLSRHQKLACLQLQNI